MSIETFKLVRERCKLVHLNLRSETHGEEFANAIDLKFEFDSANNLLSKLHPELRDTYYVHDKQADIEADFKPNLRFPLLNPDIAWELEIPRTLLRLHGETPDADVVLGGGKTNTFRLTMKGGGTVHWKFRVQFSKPSPQEIAALSSLLQKTVPVSLECRDQEDEKEGDLFDQAEKQTQQPMSEARKLAEQEFEKPATKVDKLPGTLPDESPEKPADSQWTPEEIAAFQEKGEQPAQFNRINSVIPDPEQVETEPVRIATPIAKGRRGSKRAAAGGANLE